jgi:hypothetical protein
MFLLLQDLFPEKLIRPRTEPVQGGASPGSDYQPRMAPLQKITSGKKGLFRFWLISWFPGRRAEGDFSLSWEIIPQVSEGSGLSGPGVQNLGKIRPSGSDDSPESGR